MAKFSKLGVLFSFLAVAGCVNQNTLAVETKPVTLSAAQSAMVKTHFSEKMRDPDSVNFRSVYAVDLSNSDRVVCGELNAKNGFGGYVGYSPFYIRLRGTTVMASHFGEASAIKTARVCADAKSGNLMIMPN